jgi:GT2 family glycosyltransferase
VPEEPYRLLNNLLRLSEQRKRVFPLQQSGNEQSSMEFDDTKPLVSICITSYNYGRFIVDAVESALKQTYPRLEVVISDNCSTDETMEILNRYRSDDRVRIYQNAENVGMVRNHNLAISQARGEYIVVLSADDVLLPGHVSCLIARALQFEDPLDVVYANAMFLDEQLNPLYARLFYGTLPINYSDRDGLVNVLSNYYLSFPAKLIARRVYETLGLFDETIQQAFDVDFTARIELSDFRIGSITDIVAGLREHGTRASGVAWQNSEGYISDKLRYLEKFLKPEYAWRVEGCEAFIDGLLRSESGQVAISQGHPLSPGLQTRLDTVLDMLATLRATPVVWPQSRPRVSVLVTSDGYFPLLNLTLNSLAISEYTDFEVIVMQGGGYPTRAWIESLNLRQRVRYIDVSQVGSWQAIRLAAIDIARGQLFTMLAEGQIALPYHLDRLVYAVDSASAEVVHCDRESISDHGNQLPFDVERRLHHFEEPYIRAERLKDPAEPTLSTVIHRKSLYRRNPMAEEGHLALSEGETIEYLRRNHAFMTVFNEDAELSKRYLPSYTFDSNGSTERRRNFFAHREERIARARAQLL